MKLTKIALASVIALSTLGSFTIAAPRAEATPRILLVLAKLESRGSSQENGALRPEAQEFKELDTCPGRATFCGSN